MNVSDLMTKSPATIQPDATLRTALDTMNRVGCHHLPVVNQHGALVGVITTHDFRHALNIPLLTRRQLQVNKRLDHLLVSTVMTLVPVVINEDSPAEDAVSLMLERHIGCLPVTRDHELVGIITTSDIMNAFTRLLQQQPQRSASA
jgi:CBS domain-containing protein